MKTEVVIVGGGLAGIVSAIELLNKNVKVTLVDRAVKERFGGLAQWSMGGLFYVDSPFQRKAGIKDSETLAMNDWQNFAEFGPNDILPKQWAEKYISNCTTDVYEWLKPKGIKYIPSVQWTERGLLEPGNSVPRFHVVWGTGKALTDTLIADLEAHPNRGNLTMFFRHKVEGLTMSNGKVTGVSGVNEENGEKFSIEANTTILAAGGITGNVDVVKKHWDTKNMGTPPESLLSGSHLVADGQIHETAQKIGARVTHLDKVWNYAAGVHHPDADHPKHGLSLIPPKSAVWVNYQGKRMGPMPLVSGFDTRFLVERICQEEKKYSWQILNMKIALKELGVSGALYNDAMRNQDKFGMIKNLLTGNKGLVDTMVNRCEDFIIANTVEELAAKMNELTGTRDVDASLLKKNIEDYDASIDRGQKVFNDEQLRRIAHLRQYTGDRLRTCKFQKILDSGAMPLMAIREFILARKSLGGIQTNLNSQVLDMEGNIIEGLYAVGETAGFGGGGIHGLRALEGTFLGNCVFTSRVAVGHMV